MIEKVLDHLPPCVGILLTKINRLFLTGPGQNKVFWS